MKPFGYAKFFFAFFKNWEINGQSSY